MVDMKKKHEERMKLWDSGIASHEKYLNPQTGLFDEKYVENRSCPVCNKEHTEFMFYKSGGTYVRCLDCSMVYLNPVFKDDYLNEYYCSNHTVQSETVAADLSFYNKIYTQGLNLIRKQYPAGKVLDIGCSSGIFLDLAKSDGFETYGVEINKSEAAVAKKKHRVFESDLSEVGHEEYFDFVTMWDVFEHIKDGHTILQKIRTKLKPKGGVFLQIPSSSALAARIIQEKCNMFDGLEHVNLYNLETITKMAKENDFNVIELETVISEEKVINNYLNYENPYLGSFNSNTPIFNEESILKNDLGYKIQILMQKRE